MPPFRPKFEVKPSYGSLAGAGDEAAMAAYIKGETGPTQFPIGYSESDNEYADGRGAPKITEISLGDAEDTGRKK